MTSNARVVIIGAGASGAAFAWRLAAQGVKSVCLERGDWLEPKAIPTDQPDWEFRRITDFSPNPNVRKALGGAQRCDLLRLRQRWFGPHRSNDRTC